MTLNELRYVVAVAQERSFGRAAAKCFVSQPALSVAIQKLEDELGAPLFERGKTEITITPIGERIVEQAQKVLEETARIREIAIGGRNQLVGMLRLGIIHTVAPYLLPDLIPELHAAAPQMPLDIEENTTANLDEMLKAGLIDAAILALPYGGPGLEVTPLYNEAFRVIVPAKHPWARRKSIEAGELAGEHLLLLNVGHCFRDQVLDACREFARPPTQGKQGNSLETIRNMVMSGMGISVLPASALTPKYANPMVRAIDFAPPAPSRRIVIATRVGFPRAAAIRAVVEAVGKVELPLEFAAKQEAR